MGTGTGWRRRMAGGLVAMALLAAGCGDDDGDAADEDGAPRETVSSGELEALLAGTPPEVDDDGRLVAGECAEGEPADSDTDHGVFADRVQVASMNVDFTPLIDIGFAPDQGDTTEQFSFFLDAVNDAGGVCGRTIDYEALDFDILAGEGPEACLRLTDDRRNLVVLGQEGFQEVSCVAEDGDTVMVTQNNAGESTVDAADGRLFVNPPSWNSQYEATARRFHEDGLLDGRVGVFYGGSNPAEGDLAEEALLPALDDLGVDHVAMRTDGLVSDEIGAAAAATAVTTFLTEGVETVLLAVQVSNHSGFILEAESQGLEPRWLSVPAGGNTSTAIFVENGGVVEETDGELLTSYYHIEPDFQNDAADACNAVWTEATGETHDPGSFIYSGIANACQQVDMLVAALAWASPDLTQDSVVAALSLLPPFTIGRTIGEVQYGPDDRFGGSQLQVQTFDAGCICYRPEGDPFPVD